MPIRGGLVKKKHSYSQHITTKVIVNRSYLNHKQFEEMEFVDHWHTYEIKTKLSVLTAVRHIRKYGSERMGDFNSILLSALNVLTQSNNTRRRFRANSFFLSLQINW